MIGMEQICCFDSIRQRRADKQRCDRKNKLHISQQSLRPTGTSSVEARLRSRLNFFRTPLSLLRISQLLFLLFCFLFFCLIPSAHSAPVTDDQKKIYIDEQIRLADALKQREYYLLAIEEYKRIIAEFPDDPLSADAWCGLGEAFYLAGDYKNSAETYAVFLKKYPQLPISDSVQIAYAVALAKTYPEKLSDAVKIINKIIEDSAKDEKIRESALYALGKLYLDINNLVEAEKCFKKLAEKPVQSKDDKIRILSKMEYAIIVGKSNPQRAIQLLVNLAEDKQLDTENKNSALRIAAEILLENEKYEQAAEKYKQLYLNVRGTPSAEDAIIGMAFSILKNGGHLRILQEFPPYIGEIRTERKKMKLLSLLAFSFEQEKNFDKAAELAETAISSKSSDPETTALSFKIILRTLIETRKYSAAFSKAFEALEDSRIQPKSKTEMIEIIILAPPISSNAKIDFLNKSAKFASEAYVADFIRFKKAELLIKENSSDKALDEFQSIKDETIKKMSALLEAQCLEKLGKNDDALKKYKEIIFGAYETEAKTDALTSCMTTLLFNSGKYADASKLAQEFISANHDTACLPIALFYDGFAKTKLEDFNSAAESFKKCLEYKDIDKNISIQAEIYLCWALLLGNKLQDAFSIAENIISDNAKLANADSIFVLFLGEKLYEAGEYKLADKCLAALVSRSQLDLKTQWEAKYYLALCNKKMKNFDHALKVLDNVENSGLSDAELLCKIYALLGELNLELSRKAEAAAFFERCLALPKDRVSAAKSRLGLAKIFSESPAQRSRAASYAVQSFVSAEDEETITEAMILYMRISLADRNLQEAQKTFEEFKRKYPNYSDPRLSEIEHQIKN